jgi:hypothetical protein
VCSNPAKPNGAACDDGNGCTQTDTCQAGTCAGANPVTCAPQDSCHNAGVCSPATGMCSNPAKTNGTPCDDGSICTKNDVCQTGVCSGTSQAICAPADQCNNGGACDPVTGMCVNSSKADGTPCNDGDLCTQADVCQAGTCIGASPVTCAPADQCHTAGVCNPATGACSSFAKANGAACDDGNACTQSDTCQTGTCTGVNPVSCAAQDECHTAGVCDPATGICSNSPKADGTACDDSNACTQGDTCQEGACTGVSAVVCEALDSCHVAGVCDPATGVCTNVKKPDSAACDDGNPCTQADTCVSGACAGGIPIECKAPDSCHTAGACDPATGMCENPAKPDGAPCAGGICNAGICVDAPDSGSGGSGGSGGGGGDRPGTEGGCGCEVVGAPSMHPAWLSLGLVLVFRRRSRRAPSQSLRAPCP